MLKIEPIKLLRGCHSHTGQTGQGCFLNVCSYLQGDSVITDKPSSVLYELRAPLIGLNDFAPSNEQRQRLIPFVHRAMLTEATEGSQRRMLIQGANYMKTLIALSIGPFGDTIDQRTFDAAFEFVDMLLPLDVEPTEAVAKRAADLALVSTTWGDKPLPAPPKSIDDFFFPQIAGLSFVTSPFNPKLFNELAEMKYSAKPPALKPNKPHGPLKLHKPAYF